MRVTALKNVNNNKKICAHILIHNAGVRGAHAQEQIYLRVREIAPETHRQTDRNKFIYKIEDYKM